MNEFRDRVIKYRKKHEITQAQFADMCGLTRLTIWLIENKPYHNVNMITRGKLEKILDE